MELFDISKFRDKEELFAHLVEHKSSIMARRKAVLKKADGIPMISVGSAGELANKAAIGANGIISASLVINTTNLLDSHKDLHVNSIWKRSLGQSGYFNLNQEHEHGFKDIISDGDDLTAYTRKFTWKQLGFQFEGSTEALMYDTKIKSDRNAYMFGQYKDGYVRNHSVEMYYVKQLLAINDSQYKDEYANYEKYYPLIANKEYETEGYFFPVLEAKHVGGAAVTKGSNFATPIYSIKNDPPQGTHEDDPPQGTQKKNNLLNFLN